MLYIVWYEGYMFEHITLTKRVVQMLLQNRIGTIIVNKITIYAYKQKRKWAKCMYMYL